MVLLQHITGPDELAGERIKAVEDARGAHGEKTITHDGGRGPRTVAALPFYEAHMVLMRPHGLASSEFVAGYQFIVSALLLRVGATTDHGKGSPS